MNTYTLTATDRCVINRFLLSVADEIAFSTNCLRQPLSFEMLEVAFQEVESKAKEKIEKTRSSYITLSYVCQYQIKKLCYLKAKADFTICN